LALGRTNVQAGSDDSSAECRRVMAASIFFVLLFGAGSRAHTRPNLPLFSASVAMLDPEDALRRVHVEAQRATLVVRVVAVQ